VRYLRLGYPVPGMSDTLTFATVQARLEPGRSSADQTTTMAARPAGPGMVHHIDKQDAEYIHYDERQYNWHVQTVNQQRENFLREVAGTRTKARWLAWTGFLLLVVGFGIFAATDLSFIKSISDSIQNGNSAPPTTSPFGREVGGVPIGIVLHVITTSRRKQAYREFPVLPPWPGAQPMRSQPSRRG